MALRGDLASVDLAQVFQMLALNKKVGLLSIHGPKIEKVLYFDHRGVTLYHNVHQLLDRVVASLRRSGRLTEAAIEEVRDHAARMGQPLTDSLLAGGYLQAAELEDQYRIEIDEEIYDIFFVKDAKFEFHEGVDHLEGRDDKVDERFFAHCDSVVMEAARRIDEWSYISERVPTTAEVYVAVVDSLDLEELGTDCGAVFELLDGRRNVDRIVELTGLTNFQVCKSVSQMLDVEAIAPVDPQELVALGDGCLQEGRLPDALNLYERAVGLGVGVPAVHSRAASAYQAAEQYENAIFHLECAAEFHVGVGDVPAAAQRLLEVRQLVPTNLAARERLVELLLARPEVRLQGFDPLAEGKILVDLLVEFGDIGRVRALLERLVLVAPNDPDLKKSLVNVHIKAGDQPRVIELYESIAEDLVRSERPLEAVGYLQKILLLDRSRGDIAERVRQLYESDERSRSRGRVLQVLAGVFGVLLVLGMGYWFYDQRAMAVYQAIDVREMLEREDHAGARVAYEDFLRNHPLTTVAGQAQAEIQRIEAARLRFEAKLAGERASRERELQRLRLEYRAAFGRQREQFLAGEPEAALETLSRVRELLAKANSLAKNGDEDMAWALEQQVEHTFMRLQEHLQTAAALQSAFVQQQAAGDWRTARSTALRLLTDHETTQAAASVQLPVEVRTRPGGARLLVDGRPWMQGSGEQAALALSPAVIWCAPHGSPPLVVAELDGFEPRRVAFDPRRQESVEVVLEVVADRRVAFSAPVQTGVAIGEGWVAAGIRGGRLGLVRSDGSQSRVVELAGLRSVEGSPAIQNGRVFFATNENTIDCVPVDRTVATAGWPVSVPAGFATELVAREGRLLVVDREAVVHCWEQSTGVRLWTVSLGSAAAGVPTVDRRQVLVGTVDGRILSLDLASGEVGSVLRSPTGVTTRVLADRGKLWFGGADGNVRAVDAGVGKVLWTAAVGRPLADGELALGAAGLLTQDKDGNLLTLDRETGSVLGRLPADGALQRGIRVQGDRAFVQLRRQRTKSAPAHDVLQCLQLPGLGLQWEFTDQTLAPGGPGVDALAVAWATGQGEIILFR